MLAALSTSAFPAPDSLPPLLVSASRSPQAPAATPVHVEWIPAERLASAGAVDLALRDDPAFALFRRNSSLTANPTAQGVSLRGIGPSGASRTLVLLDGLPLNDPFGGWVNWSAVPQLSLAGAEIVHGGGSGVWGNAALGGIVAFESAPLTTSVRAASNRAGLTPNRARFERGELGLLRGEFLVTAGEVREAEGKALAGPGAVQIEARSQRYDGFHPLPEARRGVVDERLSSRHVLAQLKWHRALNRRLELTATVRHFDEHRDNGTVLTENGTRLTQAALQLRGSLGSGAQWSTALWGQWQRFASFFSAVASDRNSETPSNDQFAVPATAAGASASGVWQGDDATTVLGADVRRVEGETRENFLFQSGSLTRQRRTGGRQVTGGVFVAHDRRLARDWRVSGAMRLDRWENLDGHNRESPLDGGALVRDDVFAAQRGMRFTPRLGVNWQASPSTMVRAAAYRAFRLPTLNEYYRPFRVGTVNTLANPSLRLETLDGIDVGVSGGDGSVRWSLNGFSNWIEGAVTNVTLSATPALTTRQRQNLDAIRVRGLEVAGTWSPWRELQLRLAGLWVDAEIREAAAQPALVGRRPAAVPRNTVTASAMWDATARTRVEVRGRWSSRQFDDDENQLPLAACGVVDVRFEQALGPALRAFAAVENVFDRRTETSRSTVGLVTYDQPRALRGGVELGW